MVSTSIKNDTTIIIIVINNTLVSCGDPTILTGNSSKISIADYRPPAVEGTHIYFYCPHGLLLSGHNMSTCMGNGEWEPTPREVECKGDNIIIIIIIGIVYACYWYAVHTCFSFLVCMPAWDP